MLRSWRWVPVALVLLTIEGPGFSRAGSNDIPASPHFPRLSHDLTFRPTVIIRKGNAQGSGTVIASRDGETLILTAAHVTAADEKGPIRIEIHRYNMGVEKSLPEAGWPISIDAELVAADAVGDVALLKVVGRRAFPFVAKVATADEEPKRGANVLSVGIDGGDSLTSWPSRVQDTAWFAMDPSADGEIELVLTQAERRFLLTGRAPEHGRSGGGLFSESGALVGVCVGRIAMEKKQKRPQGLFASSESVRKLLLENNLDEAVVDAAPAPKRQGRTLTPTTRSEPSSR